MDAVALGEDERRIRGSQRRVWWPKWTPASSSVFMVGENRKKKEKKKEKKNVLKLSFWTSLGRSVGKTPGAGIINSLYPRGISGFGEAGRRTGRTYRAGRYAPNQNLDGHFRS